MILQVYKLGFYPFCALTSKCPFETIQWLPFNTFQNEVLVKIAVLGTCLGGST